MPGPVPNDHFEPTSLAEAPAGGQGPPSAHPSLTRVRDPVSEEERAASSSDRTRRACGLRDGLPRTRAPDAPLRRNRRAPDRARWRECPPPDRAFCPSSAGAAPKALRFVRSPPRASAALASSSRRSSRAMLSSSGAVLRRALARMRRGEMASEALSAQRRARLTRARSDHRGDIGDDRLRCRRWRLRGCKLASSMNDAQGQPARDNGQPYPLAHRGQQDTARRGARCLSQRHRCLRGGFGGLRHQDDGGARAQGGPQPGSSTRRGRLAAPASSKACSNASPLPLRRGTRSFTVHLRTRHVRAVAALWQKSAFLHVGSSTPPFRRDPRRAATSRAVCSSISNNTKGTRRSQSSSSSASSSRLMRHRSRANDSGSRKDGPNRQGPP